MVVLPILYRYNNCVCSVVRGYYIRSSRIRRRDGGHRLTDCRPLCSSFSFSASYIYTHMLHNMLNNIMYDDDDDINNNKNNNVYALRLIFCLA